MSTLKDISEDELKEFQEIFDLVDTDHGGSISQKELHSLLNTLGVHASDEQIEAMMKDASGENNREMNFNQFVQVCTKSVETDYTPSQLSRAFRYFETDELPSGWISMNRLEEIMNEVYQDMNKVTEILTSVDPENSGKVNYQLYLNILNTEMLKSVPLFNVKGMSRKFINALVARLQPRICKFGDIIVRKGDIGREMYFVVGGFVEVISEDVQPKIFATLGEEVQPSELVATVIYTF